MLTSFKIQDLSGFSITIYVQTDDEETTQAQPALPVADVYAQCYLKQGMRKWDFQIKKRRMIRRFCHLRGLFRLVQLGGTVWTTRRCFVNFGTAVRTLSCGYWFGSWFLAKPPHPIDSFNHHKNTNGN